MKCTTAIVLVSIRSHLLIHVVHCSSTCKLSLTVRVLSNCSHRLSGSNIQLASTVSSITLALKPKQFLEPTCIISLILWWSLPVHIYSLPDEHITTHVLKQNKTPMHSDIFSTKYSENVKIHYLWNISIIRIPANFWLKKNCFISKYSLLQCLNTWLMIQEQLTQSASLYLYFLNSLEEPY